jgi:hypothetical protein
VGRDGLLRLPVGPAWGTWHDQYGFRGLTSLLRPWDGLGPAASLVRDRIRGFDRRGRSARPAPVSGREFFLGLYRGQISDRFRFPPAFPGRSLPSPRPTPPHAAGSGTKLQLIRRAGSSPARCFTTAPPHRSRSPVQPSLCPVALGHPRVQGAHNALGLPSPPMRHRAVSRSSRFQPALCARLVRTQRRPSARTPSPRQTIPSGFPAAGPGQRGSPAGAGREAAVPRHTNLCVLTAAAKPGVGDGLSRGSRCGGEGGGGAGGRLLGKAVAQGPMLQEIGVARPRNWIVARDDSGWQLRSSDRVMPG